MNLLNIIGIAIGLAMDAFAVSIAAGLTLKKVSLRTALRMAWHFGIFQAIMPLIGFFAGRNFSQQLASYDHWIAFGLLGALGSKMIYEALTRDEEAEQAKADPTKGWRLVSLSVATSLDALAVGVSMAFMKVDIFTPAAIIGVVAFGFTIIGVYGGARLGEKWEHRAEFFGGAILIAIGIKILVEHLFFQ